MTCFMLKLLLDIFRYGITAGAIHIGMSSWLGFGSWISTSLFGAGRCRCMYCPSQPPPLRWHSVQLRLWLFPVQCGYGIALHSRCWSSTWRHLPGECLAASWMNHDEPWWTTLAVRPCEAVKWQDLSSAVRNTAVWSICAFDMSSIPSGYFWILLLSSVILEALRNRNDDIKLAGFQHLHPADPAPPDSCLVAAVGCVSL